MASSERAPPGELGAILARSGRFTVLSELGRGSSGVVYDVHDAERGERVALKLLTHANSGTAGAQALSRWASVSQGCASLIRILDAGELEGRPFYTMERLLGRNIVHTLKGTRDDSKRSRLRHAFAQLARALGELHAHGYVHRDVKPDNVLFADESRVVLLDLDIASQFGEASASSSTVGTPAYMSPEQLGGGLLEPPSDFYALGVMLYETLSGSLPFPEDLQTQAGRKLSRAPTPLTALGVHAPEDLIGLCHALLHRDPDKRPDALDVLGALDDAAPRKLPGPIAVQPVWVGREPELSAMRDAFGRAQDHGAWLHVEGPLGRGKTALVERFLNELRDGGHTAMVVRAQFHGELDTCYGGLDDAFLHLSSEARSRGISTDPSPFLDKMFPGDKGPSVVVPQGVLPIDPHEQRERAGLSLRDLLQRLAKTSALVVVLDDVHNAPIDAVRVMKHWVRPTPPKGMLLITCSEQEPWPFVIPRKLHHLRLPPLSPEQATRLADRVKISVAGAPRSIEDEARKRIARCSEAQKQVLELAAVGAGPLSYEHLCQAATLPEAEVARALYDLKRLCMIGWDARKRSIHNEAAIAQVVLETLDGPQRRAHHGRWMLVHRGRGPAGVLACAKHALAAEDLATVHVAGWQAARRARQELAFDLAARLACIAHAARPDSDPGVMRELGDLLLQAGENVRAAEAYKAAEHDAPSAERTELARLRVRLLLRDGKIDSALEAAHDLLEDVGLTLPTGTGRVIASLLWNKALLSVSRMRFRPVPPAKIPRAELARVDALWATGTIVATTDAVLGVSLTTRCTRRALRCGQPHRAARALLNEALNRMVMERPPLAGSRRLIEHAATLTEGDRDPSLDAYVRMGQGVLHFFSGEPADALVHLHAAEEIFRLHTEGDINQLTTRQFALQSLLLRAQVSETRKLTELFLDQSEAQGDRHAVTLLTAVGVVPSLLFTEDDPRAARAALADAMAIWPTDRVCVQHLNALIAEMMILEYERLPGIPAAIDERLSQLSHAPLFRAPPVRAIVACFKTYGCLVEAAYARGTERKSWIARARRDIEALARMPSGFSQRRAIQLLPQLLLLEGNLDAARLSTEHARSEFLRIKHDVAWTDVLLGRMAGDLAGKHRAEAAYQEMKSFGYCNRERAFAASGADLLDGGML